MINEVTGESTKDSVRRLSVDPEDTKYQDILANFVLKKNDEAIRLTGAEYVNGHDIKDIIRWSYKDARNVYKRLKDYISGTPEITGFGKGTCPWCYKYEWECSACSYKKNHGLCMDNDLFGAGNCDVPINYKKMLANSEKACDWLLIGDKV